MLTGTGAITKILAVAATTFFVPIQFDVAAYIGDDGMGTFAPYSIFQVRGINYLVPVDRASPIICEPFLQRSLDNRIEELVNFVVLYKDKFKDESPTEMVMVEFPDTTSVSPMTYGKLEVMLATDCPAWQFGELPPFINE